MQNFTNYPALGVGSIAEWTCETCGKSGQSVAVDKTAPATALDEHEKVSPNCNGNVFIKVRKL